MTKTAENQLIELTRNFVKKQLENAEAGHDWFHIERVYNLAVYIAKAEGLKDLLIIKLGALLHDIADAKFHDGDEEIGPKTAVTFLKKQGLEDSLVTEIEAIVRYISFKTEPGNYNSIYLEILQDADRLDALGAIGIARTFNYGGFKNRPLYNPDIRPNINQTKAEYKRSTAPTLNHFYEKLFLLKDKMHTKTAQKLAQERHQFMIDFVDVFKKEWHFNLK